MKKIFAAAYLAFAIGSASLQAGPIVASTTSNSGGVIVQTGSLASQFLDINDPTGLVQFQDFGNYGIANGILNSVTLTYTFQNQLTNFALTNNGSTAVTGVNVILQSTFYLDSGSTANSDLAALEAGLGVSGTGPGNINNIITTKNIGSYTNATVNAGATDTSYTPGLLPLLNLGNLASLGSPITLTASNYAGSGNYNIGISDIGAYSFSGGGSGGSANVTVSYNTALSETATLTYNYTVSSTPEPATMTLFGSALLGIGFFARKRLKK
jgi:hypothetical protein